MKIAGFVCEFNPLHFGHKYFIDQIKKDGADITICAMSPNFVMRGEPAIFDKFFRTEKALENGIDLVLEIPTIFSIQAADIYSKKGIEILIKAGVTDIYFGSETDDISLLEKAASLRECDEYKKKLNEYLKKGDSFNAASKKTMIALCPLLENIVSNPNNLLAIEYIKSIKEIKSTVNYHLINRKDADFHSNLKQNVKIQSASALRSSYKEQNIDEYLPYKTKNIKAHFLDDYFDLIKYRIDSSTSFELSNILNVSEGIENRIKKVQGNEVNDYLNHLISKRNRETKIKRILISIFLNITKSDLELDYSKVKVLGFNKFGMKLIKSDSFITNITSTSPEYIYKELSYTKLYDESLINKEYKPIIK